MSKEPNDILVLTTCKCRENTNNLVMSRIWFEEQLANKIEQGVKQERKRVLKLLERLPFIWGGTTQMIQTSKDDVIALIEGKEND